MRGAWRWGNSGARVRTAIMTVGSLSILWLSRGRWGTARGQLEAEAELEALDSDWPGVASGHNHSASNYESNKATQI